MTELLRYSFVTELWLTYANVLINPQHATFLAFPSPEAWGPVWSCPCKLLHPYSTFRHTSDVPHTLHGAVVDCLFAVWPNSFGIVNYFLQQPKNYSKLNVTDLLSLNLSNLNAVLLTDLLTFTLGSCLCRTVSEMVLVLASLCLLLQLWHSVNDTNTLC